MVKGHLMRRCDLVVTDMGTALTSAGRWWNCRTGCCQDGQYYANNHEWYCVFTHIAVWHRCAVHSSQRSGPCAERKTKKSAAWRFFLPASMLLRYESA